MWELIVVITENLFVYFCVCVCLAPGHCVCVCQAIDGHYIIEWPFDNLMNTFNVPFYMFALLGVDLANSANINDLMVSWCAVEAFCFICQFSVNYGHPNRAKSHQIPDRCEFVWILPAGWRIGF